MGAGRAGARASPEGGSPAGSGRVRFTPEGAVAAWFAVLFTTGAWFLSDNLVFLLGCLLLGAVLGSFLLARRSLRGIEVARLLSPRARVGATTRLVYQVTNRRRSTALAFALEDRPDPGSRPVSLQVEFDAVDADATAACETDLVFGRRGLVTLAPLTLSSRYPLGLFRTTVEQEARAQVLVRPREGRPTTALRNRVVSRAPEEALRTLSRPGDDALYGVREFREGDDPRRIHWRTTARRGAPFVSEWRSESGRQVVVVLGRAVGAGSGAGRAFERAVSCAATVWRLAHRERLPALLVLGGAEGRIAGGRRGFERGLDRLARVGPQGPRRPGAVLDALAQDGGARCVVYVGAGPEPGLARRLAAAAGRGGVVLHLRADLPAVSRYVRGLA